MSAAAGDAGPSSSTRSKRPRVPEPEESPERRQCSAPARRRVPVRLLDTQQQPQRQGSCIDLTGSQEVEDDDEPVLVSSKPSQQEPQLVSWVPSPQKPQKRKGRGASTCGICLDEAATQLACGPCGHVFCEVCLRAAVQAQKRCPTCRKGMQLRQIHRVFLSDSS